MVDRIKQVMEYKQLSPAVFAEQLEISRSNLTHLFSGRNQPSLALAKKILETYPDINTEWLIMGVGNMVNEGLSSVSQTVTKPEQPANVPLNTEPDLFSSIENEPVTINEAPIEPTATIVEESPNEVPETEKQASSSGMDTMTSEPMPRRRSTSKRAYNSDGGQGKSQIFDSRGDKKVRKIVFFYADKTFEEFYPE